MKPFATMDLAELVRMAGQTPFFAYDSSIVRTRVESLRRQLPAGLRLYYSLKANPLPALLQRMSGLCDGADVSSAGELELARNSGFPLRNISFAGPGKRDAELQLAASLGVCVCVESAGELQRLADAGNRTGKRPRVALRVNPDFQPGGATVRMAGGAHPFGIDSEQVPSVLQQMAALPLDFEGFHFYCASRLLDAQAVIDMQDACLELAIDLSAHAPGPVRWLNLGGGFGIPCAAGEHPLDIERVARGLHDVAGRAAVRLPHATLVLELGRYLVGEAGIYVCRVIDRKVSRGRVFLITDGGAHHHLAATLQPDHAIRRDYPIDVVGTTHMAGAHERVTIVGPLCAPFDVLAEDAELPVAQVGDLIIVHQSGAYGPSASPLRFLGHPEPRELLL